jgi:molybdopterin synthase catalytic subunit
MNVRLTAESLDPAALEKAVAAPESGALVLFLGTVRNHHRGREVVQLTYSAYEPMAEKALAKIVAELESATPGLRAAIWHRIGEVSVGAASVIIATSSAHRQEAYEASRVALERLKKEVPIWKREHYADGSEQWREEEALKFRATEE